MRKYISLALMFVAFVASTASYAAEPVREWTFLIYLNGNNNLDSFGTKNIIDMEKIGSSDQVNVLVQWASYRTKKVTRLLIKKSSNHNQVTSPVIQNLGTVDMGSYKSLIEFVRWGVDNFPAKKYFVNVWDHGGGWHKKLPNGMTPKDISWDDISGNFMTTEQLGIALNESAKIIGHKVDIYGSDACLMAMAEVAGEMADSVSVMAGSQETEPGAGWPYDKFLGEWVKNPTASAQTVAGILTREYTKSYQGGSNGTQDVTFSSFDMAYYTPFTQSVAALSDQIVKAGNDDALKIKNAIPSVQSFAVGDYGDLIDFIGLVRKAGVRSIRDGVLADVEAATSKFVIANAVTTAYKRAHGLSLWLPESYAFDEYTNRYEHMKFNQLTRWNAALKRVLK